MKYILSIIAALVVAHTTFAQDVIDKIADETCECLKDEDLKGLDQAELELKLGVCMISGSADYTKQLKKEMGIDINAEGGAERLGEEVGVALAFNCPEFLEIMMDMLEEGDVEDWYDDEDYNYDEEEIIEEGSGTISKVEEGNVVYLLVEDDGGNLIKYYWLEDFYGSNELINNYDQLVGKEIVIYYEEEKIFSAKKKDYVTVRVIAEAYLD